MTISTLRAWFTTPDKTKNALLKYMIITWLLFIFPGAPFFGSVIATVKLILMFIFLVKTLVEEWYVANPKPIGLTAGQWLFNIVMFIAITYVATILRETGSQIVTGSIVVLTYILWPFFLMKLIRATAQKLKKQPVKM